jgi:HSP20 family protein
VPVHVPFFLDFYETKGNYHIKCDVPGFKMDEVKVEWDDDFLIIQAEHSESTEAKEPKEETRYHICERSQSQREMYRKIRIPR